jgi:hypothetical protein
MMRPLHSSPPSFALRMQPSGSPTAAPRRLVVSQSISNRRLALCPRTHVDAWPYCVRAVKSNCNCFTITCTAPALKCLGGYRLRSTAPAHTRGGEPPMPNLILGLMMAIMSSRCDARITFTSVLCVACDSHRLQWERIRAGAEEKAPAQQVSKGAASCQRIAVDLVGRSTSAPS